MDSPAVTEKPASDRIGPITAIAAVVVAAVLAGLAPWQIAALGDLPVRSVLVVVFLGSASLLLALRALLLSRRGPDRLQPGLAAAIVGGLGFAAGGAMAYLERNVALDAGPIGRTMDPAMVAWEHGQAAQISRSVALLALLAAPGLALAMFALLRALGHRKAAKVSAAKGEAGTATVGTRRKAIAAAWAALLGAGALGAFGFALDALAIAAPVDAAPHPRLGHFVTVKDHLSKARLGEACKELESGLGGGTPADLVLRELPDAVEISHRCVGHAIEQLPAGIACVEAAATLRASATTRFAKAEDRVQHACDGAVLGGK